MKKKYVVVAIVFITVFFIGYKYVYHEQRNIETENANFSIKSSDLVNDLKNGDALFNKKYLDKTIEISGKISEIEITENAILIDDKVYAALSNKLNNNIKVEDKILIKARFIGYDDLLEKFRFDQATIVK